MTQTGFLTRPVTTLMLSQSLSIAKMILKLAFYTKTCLNQPLATLVSDSIPV